MKPKVFAIRGIPQLGLDVWMRECDVKINPHDRVLTKEELLDAMYGIEGLLCLLTDTLEKVAPKGYHFVKLLDDLFFINTHLYTPANKTEKSIPESQFDLLQRSMNSRRGILAGDLNIKKGKLMELSKIFVRDQSSNSTVSSSNYLTKVRFNKFSDSDKTTDYVLKTKKGMISLTIKCLETPIISDHFIISADIKIR